MGLRMIIDMSKDFILISVDIVNAYCEVMRASVIERHMEHNKFKGIMPYWRAKLGPATNLWARDGSMEYIEGLVHGSPTSSSGFTSNKDLHIPVLDRAYMGVRNRQDINRG